MGREINLTLRTVQERLTGRFRTRCLNNLLLGLGEYLLETEMLKSQSNFLQQWNNVYNNLDMRVLHLLYSKFKGVIKQTTGKKN